MCIPWCNQVDEATPQVPNLHHLGGDRKLLMNARRSLQLGVLEVVCVTPNLDLQERNTWLWSPAAG